MHPIFFAWKGDYESLLETRFYSHGKRTRSVAIEHDKAYVGIIESYSPSVRRHLEGLHENFVLLPGPRGKLKKHHAKAINEIIPSLNAKEGDSLESTLLHVHGLYGDVEFHPDSY